MIHATVGADRRRKRARGMLRAWWVAVVAATGMAACAGGPRAEPENGAGKMRYLALGDSYTIGEGVAEEDRWPVQLAALLRRDGVAVSPPEIIARTGWTTDELSAAMDDADPRGPYALVTLLIGVNDQYRGRDAEAYRPEFARLLARAVALAGGEPGHVVVLSIPDWGVTPFAEGRDGAAIAAEIDKFNEINQMETERGGARYVDVTRESRATGTDPVFLAPDGLHYSGVEYAAWAGAAFPAARAALAGDSATR